MSLQIASEIENRLWENLLPAWFPRCVAVSGFHQNFDRNWHLKPGTGRSLVYQSRMTWVAATMVRQDERLAEFAQHGLGFLLEHLLDRDTGGFHWQLDQDQRPIARQRHAYGIAFALFALSAVALHLRDERARHAAWQTFEWLEQHMHDPVHGGYIEATELDGTPLTSQPTWADRDADAIGTPFGHRSQNTHLHLLEAMSELHRVRPGPLVQERLNEVMEAFLDRFYAEPGRLHLYVQQDWTPVPGGVSFGHDVEAVHLIIDAARELGRWPEPDIQRKCRALMDYSLQHGWDDEKGGFYLSGPWDGPADNRIKNWWTVAEGLLGLATLQTSLGGYEEPLRKQWDWIDRHQIDHEFGGWYESVGEDGRPTGNLDKAYAWKAAYHDGRALLFSSELLKGVDPSSYNRSR